MNYHQFLLQVWTHGASAWTECCQLFGSCSVKDNHCAGQHKFPQWHHQIPTARLPTLLNITCQQLLWVQSWPLVFQSVTIMSETATLALGPMLHVGTCLFSCVPALHSPSSREQYILKDTPIFGGVLLPSVSIFSLFLVFLDENLY